MATPSDYTTSHHHEQRQILRRHHKSPHHYLPNLITTNKIRAFLDRPASSLTIYDTEHQQHETALAHLHILVEDTHFREWNRTTGCLLACLVSPCYDTTICLLFATCLLTCYCGCLHTDTRHDTHLRPRRGLSEGCTHSLHLHGSEARDGDMHFPMEQESYGEGVLMRWNFLIYHDDVDDVFLLWVPSLSAGEDLHYWR